MPDQLDAGDLTTPADAAVYVHAQRLVLGELLRRPLVRGEDRISKLAPFLNLTRPAVEAAVTALTAMGLVCRHGDIVSATPRAWRLDELWPLDRKR